MRLHLLVFALIFSASPALAEKKNFPISVAVDDFAQVFAAQLVLEGTPDIALDTGYCREGKRLACRYDLGDGLSVMVSGDAKDRLIDLLSVTLFQNQPAAGRSAAAIRSVVELTNPLLPRSTIDQGLAKLVTTVLHRRSAMTEVFETEHVTYRLVLSPIQGTIFTATPR